MAGILSCFSCLRSRQHITLLTTNMKDMSLRVMKVHEKHARRKKEEEDGDDEGDRVAAGGTEEAGEWVAEEEIGVLITFVSLPHGSNRLKKIRFSEEYFDAWEAQKWWSENGERIMSLYCVENTRTTPTPSQSDNESLAGMSHGSQENPTSPSEEDHIDSTTLPSEPPEQANVGNDPSSDAGAQVKSGDWVFEDQPGVLVTVHSSPDGSKKRMGVKLSREKFGQVKAMVWWEENKVRLHQQYMSDAPPL